MKHWIYFLSTCLTVLPLAGCSQERMPTDEHLSELFEKRKDGYQEAADLVLSKNIYRLEVMSNGDLNLRPRTIDASSLAGVKDLLTDNLNVRLINTVAESDTGDLTNEIAFFNYRRGLVFSGEHKGLVYVVDDTRIQVVDQLDKIDREDEAMQGKRLYKLIEPHWYIFYEYFP